MVCMSIINVIKTQTSTKIMLTSIRESPLSLLLFLFDITCCLYNNAKVCIHSSYKVCEKFVQLLFDSNSSGF